MLSLLILLTIASKTIGQKYIRIGQSEQGWIDSKEQIYTLYYFEVPDLRNSSNLVIMIQTFNPMADPNVYISRLNNAPLTVKDADVQACEAKGQDTCVLSKDQVSKDETLYLAVVSKVSCEFSIRIDLDQELKLFRNDFIQFKMNSTQQSQIILFDVGQLNGEENEIEIIFKVKNLDQLEEPFHAYMNMIKNGKPSNDKYDYIGKDLLDNKIIEINKKQLNQSLKYFILIEAQQGAMFEVETIVNNETKQIDFWEEKQQIVEKGDYDYYFLNFSRYKPILQELDIYINLIPFQGYASLYVNLNKQPPVLQNYKWSDKNKLGDQIIITQEDLKDIELDSLYIAVYGEQFCTYSLQVNHKSHSQVQYEFIPQSVQNCRSVAKGYPLKLMMQQINNSNVQINFNRIIGYTNFIITNQYDSDSINQEIIDDFIKNQSVYEVRSDYVFLYSRTSKTDNFRLYCQQIWNCLWQIYIYLDESETREQGKACVSYHIIEDLFILSENTPHKSQIDKETYNYYKYVIQETEQIDTLSFIVTPITGQVTFYMSQSKLYPNKSSYDEYSITNVIKIAPKPGAYFISVYGNTSSKYTITVITKKQNDYSQIGQYSWHYILLSQGDPQYHGYQDHEVSLYKINLLQFENTYQKKSTVTISLYIDYGQFLIFGFDRPETNVLNSKWKAKQRLEISENDENYPEVLYLRIESSTEYGAFLISYQFEDQAIRLYSGSQHFSYLNADQIINFIYEFKSNQTFIIAEKALTNDQSLLVMKIYEEKFYEITSSKSKIFTQIKIKNQNNQQCPDQYSKCSAYLQFQLMAISNLFYSVIVLEQDYNEFQLYDEQPFTKILPLVQDNFYFYTDMMEISIICISSISTKITILAKFANNISDPYPSQEDYYKKSQPYSFTYQNSLYLSQKEILSQQCIKACLIKLSVIPEYTKENQEYIQVDEYTIQINKGSILLTEGQSQQGQLYEAGIQYYKVRMLEDDKNLMILLAPLYHCNVDLMVSKDDFPSYEKYDWILNDYFSDSLVIEAGNQVHPEMKGDYFIGVFGQGDCQFTIQYSVGSMYIYNIK